MEKNCQRKDKNRQKNKFLKQKKLAKQGISKGIKFLGKKIARRKVH